MALNRKIWMAGPVLGMLVAALAVLPPRPMPDFGFAYYRRRHRDAVESARRLLRERVDGTAAADSLARLAVGPGMLRSQDGLILVVYGRDLSRDSAQVWLHALVNELALVPGATGTAGGVPVPVVVGLRSDTTNWTYVNRRLQGTGATLRCVVDVRLRNRTVRAGSGDGRLVFSTDSGVRASSVLNWCALFARFGVPGPAVARWAGMSGRRDDRYGGSYSWNVRNLRDAARDRGVPARLPAPQFRLAGCAGGNGPACIQALGLDRTTSYEGQDRWWYGDFLSGFNDPTRAGFLVSLLTTQPPERFAALWRSERPVGAALASAYGHSVDTLVMQWARRRFIPSELEANPYQSPFGPTVARYLAQYGESRAGVLQAVASLAWAAVLLGVGALIATRRQSSA